jgi:uracil-DNA glycosylase
MDKILSKYRKKLEEQCDNSVPKFCEYASHKAKILALLQDPGDSGAEKGEKECSVWNNKDDTSINQRKIIEKYEIKKEDLLCWNFYGSFGIKKFTSGPQKIWLTHTENLINQCPNLKVIIIFGKRAWEGMFYYQNTRHIYLISAPHPSSRGMNQFKAEKRLDAAWKLAKKLIS